jgi:hypothetical protein
MKHPLSPSKIINSNLLCLLALSFFLSAQSAELSAPKIDESKFYLTQGPKWDDFILYEKALPFNDVQKICQSWSGSNQTFYGCSRISFALQKCYYVYTKGSMAAKKHEKLHCMGYDHKDNDLDELPILNGYQKFNNHLDILTARLASIKNIDDTAARHEALTQMKSSVALQMQELDLPVDLHPKNGWRIVNVKPR